MLACFCFNIPPYLTVSLTSRFVICRGARRYRISNFILNEFRSNPDQILRGGLENKILYYVNNLTEKTKSIAQKYIRYKYISLYVNTVKFKKII